MASRILFNGGSRCTVLLQQTHPHPSRLLEDDDLGE